MLIRKSRRWVTKRLKENKYSTILDYGCSKAAFELATHACDIVDYSDFYRNKGIYFLVTDNLLPYHDSQFDFIFTSHILEHIDDPEDFCRHMIRVSNAGYIEVPSPLFDNMVYGNRIAHKWWVEFCDDTGKLIFSPRMNIINECITPKDNTQLYKYFRSSIVTELYWEKSFEIEVRDNFVPHFSPGDELY
jgi:ubiquinone/menaquinone biosynthesis C-methylase UbiE